MKTSPEARKEFIFYETDWLGKTFNRLEVVRSPKWVTMKAALNLLLQRGGEQIVETGTQRMHDDPGGASTTIYGAFCQKYGLRLVTVDNTPHHMETSKLETKEYAAYIEYVLQDSISFLSRWNVHERGWIDLLYLDSMDCDPEGDSTIPQEHQRSEFLAAEHALKPGSILLLDDNNFPSGGKTRLLKDLLLISPEWECVYDWGQSLWLKTKEYDLSVEKTESAFTSPIPIRLAQSYGTANVNQPMTIPA